MFLHTEVRAHVLGRRGNIVRLSRGLPFPDGWHVLAPVLRTVTHQNLLTFYERMYIRCSSDSEGWQERYSKELAELVPEPLMGPFFGDMLGPLEERYYGYLGALPLRFIRACILYVLLIDSRRFRVSPSKIRTRIHDMDPDADMKDLEDDELRFLVEDSELAPVVRNDLQDSEKVKLAHIKRRIKNLKIIEKNTPAIESVHHLLDGRHKRTVTKPYRLIRLLRKQSGPWNCIMGLTENDLSVLVATSKSVSNMHIHLKEWQEFPSLIPNINDDPRGFVMARTIVERFMRAFNSQ